MKRPHLLMQLGLAYAYDTPDKMKPEESDDEEPDPPQLVR